MQRRLGQSLVAGAAAAALAASASPAYAKSCGGGAPPTSGSAAVAQYVEQINTATGSCATGVGKPQVKPLKPSIQRKLTQQGGADAPVLQQVATSSTYGAPQSTFSSTRSTSTRPKAKTGRKPRLGAGSGATASTRVKLPNVTSKPTPSKALSAAANVVADGSNGRLIGLALFLVAITLVALVAATFRGRSGRGS